MQHSLKNNSGLTLIEVMVALVILSIALTAIIKATAENIKNTLYLQNKTIAVWVGTDIVNQIRSGVIRLSPDQEQQQEESKQLGQVWTWRAKLIDTPNRQIKEVDVEVYLHPETRLAHVAGYLYAP